MASKNDIQTAHSGAARVPRGQKHPVHRAEGTRDAEGLLLLQGFLLIGSINRHPECLLYEEAEGCSLVGKYSSLERNNEWDTRRCVDDVASTALHINPGRTRTYLTRRQLVNQIPKNPESNCRPKA